MNPKSNRGAPKKADTLIDTSLRLRQSQIDELEELAGPEDNRSTMIRKAVDFYFQNARTCAHRIY